MSALDLSLGCLFIGVVLNVWLYGFSCVQLYIYFSNFKTDRVAMRVFVALLFCFDTVNSVLDIVFMYRYLVTNFGDMKYAIQANNEFAVDPLSVSVIGFATQLFFAWRIWKLVPGRFPWVAPLVIVILGFVSFLGAIGTTVGVVLVRQFSEFHKFTAAVVVWLACTAAADIAITISLITTLHHARTGFSHTDDVITKLIRATLQTGMMTSSFAVIDLITFCASPTTLHLVFNLPLAKLYVNSLLSTLNSRVSARDQHAPSTGIRGITCSNLEIAEPAGFSESKFSMYSPPNTKQEVTMLKDSLPFPTSQKRHSRLVGDSLDRASAATAFAEGGHRSSSTAAATVRASSDEKRGAGPRVLRNPWKRDSDNNGGGGDDFGLDVLNHPQSPTSNRQDSATLGNGAEWNSPQGVHITTVEERYESGTPPSSRNSLPPLLSLHQLNKSQSFATLSAHQNDVSDHHGRHSPSKADHSLVDGADASLDQHPYNQR